MTAYEKASTHDPVVPGAKYRWSASIGLGYSEEREALAIRAVEGAFAVASVIRLARLDRVYAVPPLASAHRSAVDPWRVVVEFTALPRGVPGGA